MYYYIEGSVDSGWKVNALRGGCGIRHPYATIDEAVASVNPKEILVSARPLDFVVKHLGKIMLIEAVIVASALAVLFRYLGV